MILSRRAVLAGLGAGTASAILWACRGKPVTHVEEHADFDSTSPIRAWLHEAVSRLMAVFPYARATAVQRARMTAAVDVIGAGIGRGRYDAALIVVRERAGRVHEHVTTDLTEAGVAQLVREIAALAGGSGTVPPANVKFGQAPRRTRHGGLDPRRVDDRMLRERADALLGGGTSSRVVYAAGLVDIDDATVLTIAPGLDLEQRLVRVRRTATRVAWNGTRPVVSEASVGGIGGVDDHLLARADLDAVSRGALEIMTPGALSERDYSVVLAPDVAASAIDATTRGLFTTTAALRPEVARRHAPGSSIASPAITLVDDPTVPGAYGGFQFDDTGAPAAPVVLIDKGATAAALARPRRPGHTGALEIEPSHLRLAPGTGSKASLIAYGVVLEGARGAAIDPSNGRIVITAARAREFRRWQPTGRVFADVEFVGDLGVFAAITGVSTEVATTVLRDEVDGLPRWRSIESPWISARGLVRPGGLG